jgi:DNA repair protein SbcD/Mre11
VATADNHLGRHYDRMLPQRLEERREWLRRGFSAAVQYAVEREAHLFLQVGDLFDTTEPRNVEREFAAAALARLGDAGVRCLGITGNHDTPRSRSAARPVATPQSSYARLGGLRLLGESFSRNGDSMLSPQSSLLSAEHSIDSETFDMDGVRVAIGGMAPDPTAPAGSDPLEGVQWRPDANLSILLLHGSLEGHVYPGAPEPIVRRRTVESLEGVDCLLVGHVHRYTALRWGGTTVVVPGSTERMTFGELDVQPGFAYLELEPGQAPELSHIPVEPQPRRALTVDSSELAHEDPGEALKEMIGSVCRPDAMVRVSLRGPITRQRYHDLRLREAVEHGVARCFFLDLDTTHLYVEDELRPPEARGGRLSQREQLAMFAEEQVAAAATEGERRLLEEAARAVLEEYE